jgi:DNA repair exonuclease SbcCD ATPase subunit
MADLAQYEQELLRRNAALEERAAASIARAKAVVDGQASSRAGVSELMAKSSSRPRTDPDEFLETLADALYEDEVENYDPDREELDERLRRSHQTGRGGRGADEGTHAVSSNATGKKTHRGGTGSKYQPSSTRNSREGGLLRDSRELIDLGAIDPAEDPVEFSDDAYGRLAKARIAALRDELSAHARDLRDAKSRVKDKDAELKTVLQEKASLAKILKQTQNALEKEKRLAQDARDALEQKAREVSEARKEAERNSRGVKASEAETKSRDVRLNRALEEVERYKNMLTDARDETKGGGAESRREAAQLRVECRKLERQKQELVNAFKKQNKLVDVLRKQKIHLEAARVVQFAEEEFLSVLEKGDNA